MKQTRGVISMTISQKEFDVATLFLSEKADHEIEINDSDVEGIVYICIYNEYNWIGFSFKAGITKSYTVGELWKDGYGTHCIDTPTVEIENIYNITVSYNDSSVENIDYTSRIDEIKTLISDFIHTQELTAPSKYNVYKTYNV